MKKNFYIAAALLAGFLWTTNAQAGDLSQTGGAGTDITFAVTATGIPGAKALTFSPSNNVLMNGETDPTGFQVNAYHTAALGKAAGQGYGMTADSNSIWFVAIEDVTDDGDFSVTGTNSLALTGATAPYTKM